MSVFRRFFPPDPAEDASLGSLTHRSFERQRIAVHLNVSESLFI
jgi:hypothetical protein